MASQSPSSSPTTTVKRTPLYDAHVAAGARMVPFAGWEMPLDYGSQLNEHAAVRGEAGLFDVSHMGQVSVRGERAAEFLDLLVPGNIGGLAEGRSRYTCLCDDHGGVIDDLIISRLSSKTFFVVVNAATAEGDVEWMRQQAARLGFDDVEIEDQSADWAMIALQGPKAIEMANQLLPVIDWTATKPFSFHCLSDNLLVSRTGYTGEQGIELLCRPADAREWWDRFVAHGAQPAGLAARDSLRLEMGYPLYGQDLGPDISPVEGGIGWTISLAKPHAFIGREAIKHQVENGAPRRRIGVLMDSRRPLRPGDELMINGRVAGRMTSGGFSPTLGVGVGLGLIANDEHARDATEVVVVSRGKEIAARIVDPPFVKKS